MGRTKMQKLIAISLTVVLLALACGSAAFAGSTEESMPNRQSQTEDIPVILDVLILRPVGLVACVVGLAAAVIALPFAIPSGSMDHVSQDLIQEPFYYTFKRPLGKNMPRE
jgi:hypothetical protein